MKNKLSRLAVPYIVWMALFVVAPIVLVVVYAFSNGDSGYGELLPHGNLCRGIRPLL